MLGQTDYLEQNSIGREQLQALVNRLTEEQYSTTVGDGWTVAAILAHLAFWDLRVYHLISRWKVEGIGRSPIDMDNVNDAMKPLCLAIPGFEAGKLALSAAVAVDQELASLPENLVNEIKALVETGKFRLNRSLHRREHLAQIYEALNKRA